MNRLLLLASVSLAGQISFSFADSAPPDDLSSAHHSRDLFSLDISELLNIEVIPSADASDGGLTRPLPGGQLANGGRTGLLGPRPILESPFSVTSYTHEFIQQQQAASVGDVLQFDSTVRVARGFANFQQAYLIRGLPVFSDEMAYNGLYGMLPRQYLAAELVERIEILRGPHAFLNGAAPNISGMGGAINVMPKRAPNNNLNKITVGTQSNGQGYFAADLARRSSDKRVGARVNAVHRDGDAAVESESQRLDLTSIGLDFHNDDVRVSAEAGFQDHHLRATTPSININTGVAIPRAPDADSAIAQPWTYSDEQDVFGNLRTEYDFTDNITGWLAGGVRFSEESSSLAAFLNVSNDAGDYTASRFDVNREDDVSTAEFGVRMLVDWMGLDQQITLSANTYRNESENAYLLFDAFANNLNHPTAITRPTNVVTAGGYFDNPERITLIRASSLALAHETAWFDAALQLSLGARLQALRELNYDYSSGARVSDYDEDALTPAIGVVYAINLQWSAYANYTEGLLRGDIAPTSNANGTVANAGEALAPYHVEQTEMGIKHGNNHHGATLALFEINRPMAGFNGNNALVELTAQRNRGIEGTLYGELLPSSRLLLGSSWLDPDVEGKDAIGSPHLQFNLNLEWDMPSAPGLTFGGHWMYTGPQYADAENTQKLPAWRRLDMGARYVTQLNTDHTFTLRMRLENVENRNYWASSGGYPGQGYLTLGAPRTAILSMEMDFSNPR